MVCKQSRFGERQKKDPPVELFFKRELLGVPYVKLEI